MGRYIPNPNLVMDLQNDPAFRAGVASVTAEVAATAAALAGPIADEIYPEMLAGGPVMARVVSGHRASVWREFGTAPHRIEVSSAEALDLPGISPDFVEYVDHPGEPPRPFMRPAAQKFGRLYPV